MSRPRRIAVPWTAGCLLVATAGAIVTAGCGSGLPLAQARAKADLGALHVSIVKDHQIVPTTPHGFDLSYDSGAFRQFSLPGFAEIDDDYELVVDSPRLESVRISTIGKPAAGEPAGIWRSRSVFHTEREDCGFTVTLEKFGDGPLLVRVEEICGLPSK